MSETYERPQHLVPPCSDEKHKQNEEVIWNKLMASKRAKRNKFSSKNRWISVSAMQNETNVCVNQLKFSVKLSQFSFFCYLNDFLVEFANEFWNTI